MDKEVFLTIIIRCYNREDTIFRSLTAAISQTLIDKIQILIIDDCSTDNSVNLISEFINAHRDVYFTLVTNTVNMGRGKALNIAKEYIDGKYCCILDSDDIYNRTTWVDELYTELDNVEYDILYNGNTADYHVRNIYLSSKFKMCPIINQNYYEDHYTRWFHVNGFRTYIYKIDKFYDICYDSNDRNDGTHEVTMYNRHYNFYLMKLFEDVFYYRNEQNDDDLIQRTLNFHYWDLDDILLESYNEIKKELGV